MGNVEAVVLSSFVLCNGLYARLVVVACSSCFASCFGIVSVSVFVLFLFLLSLSSLSLCLGAEILISTSVSVVIFLP